MIGMGIPLHKIPDIRRVFNRDVKGSDEIDFENDVQAAPSGITFHFSTTKPVILPTWLCLPTEPAEPDANFFKFQIHLSIALHILLTLDCNPDSISAVLGDNLISSDHLASSD